MQETLNTDLLRASRIARGLSQSEVAEHIGVSQASVSLWENGQSVPDASQWQALSEFLQLSTSPQAVQVAVSGDPEGLDNSQSSGWGDYPLDSVFVRTDQRTVSEVVKRINANRYDLNPEFQRDFVWPIDKQSRLIESCIMRIPLPVLYVAEAID
jgi:transcriptional regulator with XRE-family HTH domain